MIAAKLKVAQTMIMFKNVGKIFSETMERATKSKMKKVDNLNNMLKIGSNTSKKSIILKMETMTEKRRRSSDPSSRVRPVSSTMT